MIYLALGSNLGNRLENIHKAYKYLSYTGEIVKKSPVYESKALTLPGDNEKQPDFLNSVIEFETDLNVTALLFEIKAIENKIGKRSGNKWKPRHIDIDILFYHDVVRNEDDLSIPHPEIRKRSFVLKPLIDVAGNINIPPDNTPASKILETLKDKQKIKYFADE